MVGLYVVSVRIGCGRVNRRVALSPDMVAPFAAVHLVANMLAAQLGMVWSVRWSASGELATWYQAAGACMIAAMATSPWIPGWKELLRLPVDQARGFHLRHGPSGP